MPGGAASLKVSEIMAAVAQELRDPEKNRLGPPFYLSAIQRALGEMNYATGFHKKIFQTVIPDNLIVDLPDDLTSKDGVWLFNGDECDIQTSTILFIKPNMWHNGGDGYVANNKGRNQDLLQWSLSFSESAPLGVYFAGEHMGRLYLSSTCRAFDRLHITYIGMGVDTFGEDFEVPYWCREAVTDWAIHKAALAMEREDPQFFARVIARKEAQLDSPRGSWHTAIGRYKRSDKKRRYDTEAYTTRFGHFP